MNLQRSAQQLKTTYLPLSPLSTVAQSWHLTNNIIRRNPSLHHIIVTNPQQPWSKRPSHLLYSINAFSYTCIDSYPKTFMEISSQANSDVLHPRRTPRKTSPLATHTFPVLHTHRPFFKVLASDYSYIIRITIRHPFFKATNIYLLIPNIGAFPVTEIAIFLRVILAIPHTRKLKRNLPVIASYSANLRSLSTRNWTFIKTT